MIGLSNSILDTIDVAKMDFQKAFDSVTHSKLCHKLKCYGVSGKLLNWLTYLLYNHIQAVRINNKTSVLGAASLVQFFSDIYK